MRAILIDPAKRTLAEVRVSSPHELGPGLIGETAITAPGWLARYGYGERVFCRVGSDDGAFRVDVPCCAGKVFRGRSMIVGGDLLAALKDSQMELSVAKQIIKWGEQ